MKAVFGPQTRVDPEAFGEAAVSAACISASAGRNSLRWTVEATRSPGLAIALLTALTVVLLGAALLSPAAEAAGGSSGSLSAPAGIAIDSSANVYVADTANDRIRKFDPDGVPLATWGSTGGGQRQFRSPSGIAVDSSGTIFVADTGNNRVQRLFSSGQYDQEWGGRGGAVGEFRSPRAIATDSNGRVWVADTGNNRVQRFNSWGYPQCVISGAGEGEGGHACGTAAGGPGVGAFSSPAGIATAGNSTVFIASNTGDRIIRYSSDGEFETAWGGPGGGDGEFSGPAGIAADTAGSVFVTDSGNSRVQRFTGTGGFLTKWGTAGNGEGELSMPLGIADGPGGVSL